MDERAVAAVLERGLLELAVRASPAQIGALAQLASALERWGSRINLTGHRDAETIARRLILDAAALLQTLPQFDSLADLGSGAGFPGLPMAVLAPDRRFVLVESRERRHFFQRDVVRRLSLSNVRAVHGRFDEIEPELCAVVVAQAVAGPDAIAEDLRRWALPGGLIVVPGGESPRTSGASDLPARLGSYRVPLEGPLRTVWIAQTPG